MYAEYRKYSNSKDEVPGRTMYLEGMLRLYIEKPDEFWKFIYVIFPIFIYGVLWGILEYSRELNNRARSSFLKPILIASLVGTICACVVYEWFPGFNLESLLVFALWFILITMPLCGGVMTGMRLLQFYRFVLRTYHSISFK